MMSETVGVIERVTRVLTERLHAAGVGVTILSLSTQAPELLDDCLRTGIPLVYVPNRQVMHCPENVAFLRRFFAEQPIDVVVYQDSYAPSDFILDEVDFPWEQRLIVAEHNTPNYSLLNNRILPRLPAPPLRRLLRWVLRPRRLQRARRASAERHGRLLARCRRYVLLSESSRPELLGLCGTRHADKVDVITNPPTIAPAPQGMFRKKRQILFVGALDPRKGLDYLLNIRKRFHARGYADWELLIDEPPRLQQMQREAVRKAHCFSPEAITEQWLALFRRVAETSA